MFTFASDGSGASVRGVARVCGVSGEGADGGCCAVVALV